MFSSVCLISCSCYQLFQLFFFIFLTLLCSFVFFSILSCLLIWKLDFHCYCRCIYCISYFWLGVLISYAVCHDSVGTLFYFFHLVLLSSVFLFPQYHLLLLSALSMSAWNSSLRFSSSYHTSVSL